MDRKTNNPIVQSSLSRTEGSPSHNYIRDQPLHFFTFLKLQNDFFSESGVCSLLCAADEVDPGCDSQAPALRT